MANILSSSEFGSGKNTGQSLQYHEEAEAPLSLSSKTNTSVGQQTAWRSKRGTSLSRQTSGSTLNFDDASSTPLPKSDPGANFLKG
jgi:hypothetical protein